MSAGRVVDGAGKVGAACGFVSCWVDYGEYDVGTATAVFVWIITGGCIVAAYLLMP